MTPEQVRLPFQLARYFKLHKIIWEYFTDTHVGGAIDDCSEFEWNDDNADIGEFTFYNADNEECVIEMYGDSIWRKDGFVLVTDTDKHSFMFSNHHKVGWRG